MAVGRRLLAVAGDSPVVPFGVSGAPRRGGGSATFTSAGAEAAAAAVVAAAARAAAVAEVVARGIALGDTGN